MVPDKTQIITFIIVALLTGICYILAVEFDVLIIFVICLDAGLVILGLLNVTQYEPGPILNYAAAAGIFVFLFIFIQSVYYALLGF